jgi:hypothetical protein
VSRVSHFSPARVRQGSLALLADGPDVGASAPLVRWARAFQESPRGSWWHERGARAHINLGRYNTAVPPTVPPPQPDQTSPAPPHKANIYRLEAAGILIIGAIIMALILIRYWHHIAWGAR